MFKIILLNLLLITSSTHAMEIQWDDHEQATGLHVTAIIKDKVIIREAQQQDLPFYIRLFGDSNVTKLMGSGKVQSSETITNWHQIWVNRFVQGLPFGKLTLEQDGAPIGCAQLAINEDRPGVGEISLAFIPFVQGKGLGFSVTNFLFTVWAPFVRTVGLGQDPHAPTAAINKFKCFGGKELERIYATARPSNPASWQLSKHFDCFPSPPTNLTFLITCDTWQDPQKESLEQHLIEKHFSQNAPYPLQEDVLYAMFDENRKLRTMSYESKYGSLRYHFDHEINISKARL